MTGCCVVRCLSLILCSSALAQAQAPPTDGASAELPKLEKFDPSLIDKTKDPCTDFYQYTCSKWIAAHPIPPDLPSASVILPLYLYVRKVGEHDGVFLCELSALVRAIVQSNCDECRQ